MADKGLVAELYADAAFWEKLGKHNAQAGPQLVHKALVLYYTMNNRTTPNRIKASIMGALAYFILPLDAIPDAIIGVGYLDDGTMVVVEGGRAFIGQEVVIIVTSVLQTPAGRMIFGRCESVAART